MVEHANSFEEIGLTQNHIMSSNSQEEVVYLNNAGQARLTPQVQEVGRSQISLPAWEMHAEQDQQTIRELFATLIEAQAKDIAVMPSTAFATTFAARNVQRLWEAQKLVGNTRQNKILVLSDQFCSAVYPWQEFCDESNDTLSLKIVSYPSKGKNWTEMIVEALSENDVLVACLPPLHWSDGALIDLKKIGAICRDKNIVFIVDATQAVGIMPCSVREIRPDVLACSVHKWLRGPHGASLVYVSSNLHSDWQPLDQHGRSRDMAGRSAWDASKNDMGPKGYPEKYFSDARKFDSGGKANPIILPMLRTSMECVVQNVNLQRAQGQLNELVKPLIDWAVENGFSLPTGPHACNLIGLRPNFLTPKQMLDICSKLQNDHNVFIAVRCGAFRISAYLDTTPAEIAKLIDVLSAVIQQTKNA
jgi:selenocysteine lyase/cysteine desulfurase